MMNIAHIRKLAPQYITQLYFLDEEITDALEGECQLWQSETTTFVLDFTDLKLDEHQLKQVLQKVAAQMDWLQTQRETVLSSLQHAQADVSVAQASLHYVAFFVENSQTIFCDLVLTSPEWGEQIAEFSLDNDAIQFNGWETW